MPRTSLTAQDKTTLRTLILNAPETAAMRAAGDDGSLIAWLNSPPPTGAVSSWRNIPARVVAETIDTGEMDNITSGAKQWAIGTIMPMKGGIDATTAGGRKAITDLFANSSVPLTRAAVLVAAQESATRAQAAIGGSNASSASPNVVTALVRDYTGLVTEAEMVEIRGSGW